MKIAAQPILGVIFVLALVAESACGASTSSSTSNSSPTASSSSPGGGNLDKQVPMPSSFPLDFPIYPGARLTAATTFTSNGGTDWSMEWETVDSVDKAQAFYAAKLKEGDWALSLSGTTSGVFSAIFNRSSNSKVAGILSVDGSTGVTKISLELVNGG